MATVNKTWDFTSSTTGWSFTSGGAGTGPATGSTSGTNGLVVDLAGRNLFEAENAATDGWQLSNTFANIFGIGPSDTVTQIGVTGGADFVTWLCTVFVSGAGSNDTAAVEASVNGGITHTVTNAAGFSTTTSAANNIAVALSLTATGSDTLKLNIWSNLTCGNSKSAHIQIGLTKLSLTLTYTPSVAAFQPRNPAINLNDPAFMFKKWQQRIRRHGRIFVPGLWLPEPAI